MYCGREHGVLLSGLLLKTPKVHQEDDRDKQKNRALRAVLGNLLASTGVWEILILTSMYWSHPEAPRFDQQGEDLPEVYSPGDPWLWLKGGYAQDDASEDVYPAIAFTWAAVAA
jgi:hypothetical protein